MGLDWNPLHRPLRGKETEFRKLLAEIKQCETAPKRLVARFQKISEPPFATLGAPRVGFDPAADAWLRRKLIEAGRAKQQASVAKEMRGYYVLDLLPDCDGFPVYSNSGLYGDLERFSFRAQFLKDVEDVLGAELMERAYSTMSADELEDYGRALLLKARAFAKRKRVARVESVRAADFPEGSAAARAHILFAAAKWCLFWAERGHGLDPWF
jgi:hypothetical protein